MNAHARNVEGDRVEAGIRVRTINRGAERAGAAVIRVRHDEIAGRCDDSDKIIFRRRVRAARTARR